MNKILFFTILILLTSKCTTSQTTKPSVDKYDVHDILSKSLYLEDWNQLIDSIQANHPQPYEFITKEAFEQLVESQKALITDTTTISEFVWQCNAVIAAVGCGHSVVSPENILELPPSILFPMAVIYIDTKLYVIDPLSNKEKVSTGTEILSINGIDIGTLRNNISAHISSDGYNKSLQNLRTNSYFPAHCAFQLGFPPAYKIIINDEGNLKEIVLNPSNEKSSRDHHLNHCQNNLCFEVDTINSLAILTIRSFVYYNENFSEFESFIDHSFAKIHALKLENLVIDLRNNGGGDPFCASYLLQHLSDKPFRYYKKGSTQWYAELKRMIPLHKNRFIGKPYILTNGACFSTSGHLTSLIKSLNSGIFIGQETGATYSCNANTTTFLLQHTGLFTSVATATYQTDVAGFVKNRGIIPDYQINHQLSDIINDKDLEMEKVIQLINEK